MPCAVTVRNGCDGTGCPPDEVDEPADERGAEGADEEALDEGLAPVDDCDGPPRGPAPVPVPEIWDAQPAARAAHATNATAGRMRTARTLDYPTYGFALTRMSFIVFPLGVSYSTVSPSRAPVSALPSGDAAE